MALVVRPRLRSRQLVGLRHRKEFVEAMKPGEVIAFAAIEKAHLPNINVEKPEERTKRQALGKRFQFPPGTDGVAADPGIAPGKLSLRRDARFPVRIAIMFFDEDFHARERVMVHLVTPSAGRTVYDYGFVHFVVAALSVCIGQFFITA